MVQLWLACAYALLRYELYIYNLQMIVHYYLIVACLQLAT